MTITNPVGQQLTPTCCCCSTRGGKQEQNLHTEGHLSPSKPSAGGRASGRQSRRVGNRRTGRHTRNYQTITRNLCATSPPKCLTFYHSPPLPQPRASTTPTLHFPNSPPPQPPPPPPTPKKKDANKQNHLFTLINFLHNPPPNTPPHTHH